MPPLCDDSPRSQPLLHGAATLWNIKKAPGPAPDAAPAGGEWCAMTLGEYLVALLEAYGVDTVFGIPGVHTVEMYRGLARSPIRHIATRHEQAAGFMADGYARSTGRPGVCLLITGPGLTNAATALGQAYADSVPVLAISAVNGLGEIGHGEGALHESPNQSLLTAQVTAWSHRVLAPADLPKAMARAFALFSGARPRPVHIEIPIDLFAAPADGLPLTPPAPLLPARPAAAAIAEAAAAAKAASRPVLLLGGGVRHAAAEAQALAERLDAPAVMTVNARGVLAASHPLAVPASASLPELRQLIAASDLVLAFGTELGPTDYDMYADGGMAAPSRLVRADIEAEQLMRNRAADVPLLGDAKAALADLLAALGPGQADASGAARAAEARAAARAALSGEYRAMVDLLDALHAALPEAAMIGDSTQAIYAGNLYFGAERPRAWFNASTGFGALGYGLPAALGLRAAEPDRPLICITGDGGLQFVLGELGTAMELGGPTLILVWNNRGYGEIKSSMIAAGVEPVGVDLHTPDFCAIGAGYGLDTALVHGLEDVVPAATRLLAGGRPALLELRLES